MTQSTKRVSAITAVIAVVLLAVWYIGLFRPQTSSLHKANTDYTQVQATAGQLTSQIASLEALEHQIPQDSAKLAKFNAAVPKTPDLQDMLTQLHALAVNAGVQLTSVSPSLPGPGTASASSAPVTLTMNVTGLYTQLRAFLTGLTQMPRIIVVNQLSVAGSATILTASITAHMFYAP